MLQAKNQAGSHFAVVVTHFLCLLLFESMDEDAPTPDVLILTRQPSSYAVPSALVVVGLAFASVYYLSFGVIFTTVQVPLFYFVVCS